MPASPEESFVTDTGSNGDRHSNGSGDSMGVNMSIRCEYRVPLECRTLEQSGVEYTVYLILQYVTLHYIILEQSRATAKCRRAGAGAPADRSPIIEADITNMSEHINTTTITTTTNNNNNV